MRLAMTLDLPYWLKQRQAKVEDLGQGLWKITGPNLTEAVVGVQMEGNLRWRAFVRNSADAADSATTEAVLPTARDALAAAFELYRERFVN
jgi:hypothetical protein